MNTQALRQDLYKEAEEEGQISRLQGHTLLMNPYVKTTPFYDFWEKGWIDQDRFLRLRVATHVSH